MEALKAEENLEVAGRRMRELQARWKQVALAPRAQGEAMWRRFKTAQDEVFARTSAHLRGAERRARRQPRAQAGALRAAEALADSTDWVKTATAIQALQAEWKTIGPVTRGNEKAVWERFRAACDRFFTRRQEDLKHRKDEWAGNLARKEALCEQAEALADSTDWDNAAAQVKRLQAEWKTIGPVRKSKSEAVWQRFRAACDRFFDRYKHRDQVELQEKAARARSGHPRARGARATRRPTPTATRPTNLYDDRAARRARGGSRRPNCRAPCSRISPPAITRRVGQLVATWPAAFAGTDLDPEATRKRMEKLVARVEELLPRRSRACRAQLSPTELLAQQWRERLAANTMSRGRAAEENEEVALARRRAGSPQRAVAVDAARARARRRRRAAERAFPARVSASSTISGNAHPNSGRRSAAVIAT